MAARQCYHCKSWIQEGEAHDCWTTTEAALTQDLSEDLRDAWERLRETAAGFGEQRIYASHKSIMFSRRACYFFVRPKRTHLEVCVFLGRPVNAPQVRRVEPASKSKLVHFIRVHHRDEVEAPLTDWLREAYELARTKAVPGGAGRAARPPEGPGPKLAARKPEAAAARPLRENTGAAKKKPAAPAARALRENTGAAEKRPAARKRVSPTGSERRREPPLTRRRSG